MTDERCKKGSHQLKLILEQNIGYGSSNVVRWCTWCGAVVIDTDTDNRVDPGAMMKMQFPKRLIRKD